MSTNGSDVVNGERFYTIVCATCGTQQRYLAPAHGGRPPSKCAKHRYVRTYVDDAAPAQRWVPVGPAFVAGER